MNGNISDQKGAFMFHGAQQPHHHSAVKPTYGGSTAKIEIQRALSVLQLLGGVSLALFLPGVVVPSFVRPGMAATHDSAAGSLHALTIGGVTFRFTLQNRRSALLGGAFGLLVRVAIDFPADFSQPARQLRLSYPGP